MRKVTNIFQFRPGVIVNSNQSIVYLMNLQRGIDAVDLSSGKLLWSTTNGAKPLLLDGRRLVAQAEFAAPTNRLRVVVLDVQDTGKLLLETIVQLPKNVKVAIDDALGTTFHTSARLDEDKVVVSWQYSEQPISGAQHGPNANVRVTAGAMRIDLKTGHTDTPTADLIALNPETQLPDNVARLIKLGTLPGPLWQVGNVLAAIERTSVKGKQRAVLRRWDSDSGQPMPEVVLFDGELTFRYTSADGRHLLASKRLDSATTHWVWRIYSLETGMQVAEVRNASPAAWFFITASTLIFEVPPTGEISNTGVVIDQPFRLRAIKLATSNELWEWAFRDTTYRGPLPPRLTPGSRTP